jgi:hypothetical protein
MRFNDPNIECCVFCGAPIPHVTQQHNPRPAADEGHCCGMCNDLIVIPERIAQYRNVGEESE